MDALTYITDKALDQQTAMQMQGVVPAYLIIGEKEANLIMETERQFPMVSGTPSQKTQLLGMEVVVDRKCASRVDVAEGFSLMTWHRRKRQQQKIKEA